ncbi:MAG: cytochrome c oxidase subunit 3 [Saprospiraceae bacterium]
MAGRDPYNQYKSDYKNLILHPYKIMLFFLLISVSMIFVGVIAAYLYQRITMKFEPVRLPYVFLLNACILLLSSYTLNLSHKAYLEDNTEKYKKMLLATLGVTLIFMAAQAASWTWMYNTGQFPASGIGGQYIIVFGVLHFVHIFAGLPFFILFIITAYKRMKEPVSVLIYFSDPEKKMKLRLLSVYWHYLDVLWWILVLFFTFNYLI